MSQPRKILHLISRLDGYGLARQLRHLVEQQRADGHQVRIVALSADRRVRRTLESLGTTCRVLESRWAYDPIAAWRLACELREQAHDFLHVWGPTALRYANFARSDSTTAPWVATLSQLPPGRFKVDCLVVPDASKQANEKIRVIPPGVLPSTSDPLPRAELLAQPAFPEDARIIAIAGRLTRNRSIDDAIWCFELVRTLEERARLLIFGEGPDQHRLERFVRLASEPNAVQLFGCRDDLDHWLPQIDVFWQLGDEQLPMAALEAMAAKVPVVAADAPVSRRILDAGRTGYLFPAGSRALCARHTLRLLEDKKHASTMAAAAAAEIFRRFSPEAFLQAYGELYERLLPSRGGVSPRP